MYILSPQMHPKSTVEISLKEPRFFPGSLDRFLINGLVFLIRACKVLLARFLFTVHALHKLKLFSAIEFLRILENTVRSISLLNNIIIC